MFKGAIDHAKSALWWVASFLLFAVYSTHFFLIQLTNMPISPLQLSANGILHSWVHPYFNQKWSFFAPTPPDRDRNLVAKGRYLGTGGTVEVTPWTDVTTPFYKAVADNRLTPFFLVEIGMSNALVSLNNSLAQDPRASFEKDGHRYFKPEIPSDIDVYDTTYLLRHATAALNTAFPDIRFTEIQLAILTREYPRFTERNDPAAKDTAVSFSQLAWQPAPQVAPFNYVPQWSAPIEQAKEER